MIVCSNEVFCISRLFRRGSRASLINVTEDGPKLPVSGDGSNHLDVPQGKIEFTKSLGDVDTITPSNTITNHIPSAMPTSRNLYDMVNSSHSSDRYEGRPPPTSPAHIHAHSQGEDPEGQEVATALDDLDDFLDLLSASNMADRIDNQRSPLPGGGGSGSATELYQSGGSGMMGGVARGATVPRYYLSTSSNCIGGGGGSLYPPPRITRQLSPPAYSMPNLTVERVEEVEEDTDSDPSRSPDGLAPASHVVATGEHHHTYSSPWVGGSSQESSPPPPLPPRSDEEDKSHSSSDLLAEASQDGFWQTSPPSGGGSTTSSSYGVGGAGGGAFLSPVKRKESDSGGARPTSPLAMTSYNSQGRGSPEMTSHVYAQR